MSPLFTNILFAKRGAAPRTAIHRGLQWLVMLALVISLFMTPVQAQAAAIPTFSIVSVATDSTVTIQTYNFPADQIFTVRMGAYGTLGIGGIVVATTNSGAGGSFQETYDIPDELAGSRRIALRLDGEDGYYAYNWFWNSTAPTPPDGTAIPDTGGDYYGIPTFHIVTVVTDETVTVRTNNYPADRNFTVRIGAYGTLGKGGVVVGTTNSGAGGTFEETYDIPDSLQGSRRLAIRMDAPGGFFAYNWFWNNNSAPSPGPIPDTGYTGIPSFRIQSVVRGETVTILTHNFPADVDFTVRMGAYGTLGVGGPVVATTNSGAGGAFEATYDIPDSLQGNQRIAIRMDAPGGYYAYNWFWNNTTGGEDPDPDPDPGPIPDTGYSGIPTFRVQSVVRDETVTLLTNNFPADQNFTVRMGAYGTLGIGGVVVATTNSGAGGAFEATYDIPDSLSGAQRIAVRMESSAGYFAYNWFWNNTTP